MKIEQEIEKFVEDLNKEFETHAVEIKWLYLVKERILTLTIEYPLANGNCLFLEYVIPPLREKNYFESIKSKFVDLINKYIREESKKYGYEY